MKFSTVFNFIILFYFYSALQLIGQANLQKNISLDVNRQRLDNVLEILSNKGDFYFSYNSNIIKKDSLVSFRASNKTVKEILRNCLITLTSLKKVVTISSSVRRRSE